MPKRLLATTIIMVLAIDILSSMSIVSANFMPATTHIRIVSPDILVNSALHYNYQNSTVNLTISVTYVKEGSFTLGITSGVTAGILFFALFIIIRKQLRSPQKPDTQK